MEEAELIKVAFQGTEMCLRLAGTSLKEALKFLKFLLMIAPNAYRWHQESMEKAMKNAITKAEYEIITARKEVIAGSIDLNKFLKVYAAEERTMLSIPDGSAELFSELASKNKLAYALMPDLDLSDGMFQIMVPNSQADIYKSVIEMLINTELKNNEIKTEELTKELNETEKEIVKYNSKKTKMEKSGTNETEPEKYAEVVDKLEELELAKAQIEEELEDIKENYSKVISYEEYVNTNPQAVNHANMFCSMMDEGIALEKFQTLNEFMVYSEKSDLLKEIPFEKSVENVAALVNTDKEVYITSKLNPNNYIRGFAYQKEKESGEPFVCSEYEVMVNGEKQTCGVFSHGEYLHYSDGKSKNTSSAGESHWQDMKDEMQKKTGIGNDVVVFTSKEDYEKFVNSYKPGIEKGNEYLVNPDIPLAAVRKDKVRETGETFNRYTLIVDGEDTKIKADIKKGMTENEKSALIRVMKNEIKKLNPNADLTGKWQCIKGEENFNEYTKLAKVNIPSDKEELVKEFKAAFGEKVSEEVKDQMTKLEKAEKNIVILPQDNMYIWRDENEQPEMYTLFSDDRRFSITIPAEAVKIDEDKNRIVILKEGETLEAKDKNSHKLTPVRNQKDMDAFIKNKDAFKQAGKSVNIGKEMNAHAARLST